MKQNRETVVKLIEHFIEQREVLPKFSKIGTDNYSEIDELLKLFTYYLHTGDIPDMSGYLEETSWTYALWLLGKYKALNSIIEEILNDN